ncbi:DUF1294 domain-containing protein [Ectobacillus ponti]|uniref:DUF1294 domain-containing protein n=1 Tax=Ectobacillus ponti TaxID=2961894 RepID=A0AA41X595_9BACI|nr:DUF1294 domain-containing protein [Ectobacillus ponti]MCP8969164.1 DUF1294 domain-containing protein [Ectobacillus ponti]
MIWLYILVVNAWAFGMMGYDKRRAKRHEWRISERALLLAAAAGGAAGIWSGMYMFRHKTKKMKFTVGVPVLACIWLLTLWGLR